MGISNLYNPNWYLPLRDKNIKIDASVIYCQEADYHFAIEICTLISDSRLVSILTCYKQNDLVETRYLGYLILMNHQNYIEKFLNRILKNLKIPVCCHIHQGNRNEFNMTNHISSFCFKLYVEINLSQK